MPATEGIWRTATRRDGARHWSLLRFAAASEIVALTLGLFLLARRAVGAFSSPLRIDLVVATALMLVAWAWFVRLGWAPLQLASVRTLVSELGTPISRFAIWLPIMVIALFAIACSFPGNRLADWGVWPLCFAAVLFGPRVVYSARRGLPAVGCDVEAERVLQQHRRYRTAEGQEAVRGTLLAEFAPGERNATLYVAFCPPFERLPHVEVSADGPRVSVKLVQVLHNGAQIEVRLPEAAHSQRSTVIGFFASERPNPDDKPIAV